MNTNTILRSAKTIAMVGLSDKPERPSYQVAAYLQQNGYRIIPINPMITEVLGEAAYPSVSAIPPTITIDILDVFRRSEEVTAILKDLMTTNRRPFIWLQEGVGSGEALQFAKEHNLEIIMNTCIMKYHHKLKDNN